MKILFNFSFFNEIMYANFYFSLGKVYSIVGPDDMKRYKEILKDLGEDSQIEIIAPTINKQTREKNLTSNFKLLF